MNDSNRIDERRASAATPAPAPTRRRHRSSAIQALFAAGALLGAVSMADFGRGDTPTTFGTRKVSEVVRPADRAPRLAPAGSDSVAQLVARYTKQGYKVSEQLGSTIASAARKHGVNLETAFALIRMESGFSNKATSPVGAVGLSQLMPKTARWLRPGVTIAELRDPATNVDIGFGYLKTLVKRYKGNDTLALLAYNRGPGTVDRILARGGNPDNGYAAKIQTLDEKKRSRITVYDKGAGVRRTAAKRPTRSTRTTRVAAR